jgi:hypothetical protein
MKKIVALLTFSFSLLQIVNAQNTPPQLLTGPANWQFEKFPLPPEFAPGIPYKGVEELRFSPNMFKKDSSNYFSYAFAAQLDNTTDISQSDINNYLVKYFKGICSTTATARKLVIDSSKITVSVEKKKDAPADEIIYNAWLNVFGVFDDGAQVKLNAEIKVLKDASNKKVYLIFIASPHPKTDEIWKMLHKIQSDFRIPAK